MTKAKHKTCDYIKVVAYDKQQLGFDWGESAGNYGARDKKDKGIQLTAHKIRKKFVDNDKSNSNFSLETESEREKLEDFIRGDRSDKYIIIRNSTFFDCIKPVTNLKSGELQVQFVGTNLTFPIHSNILVDAIINGTTSSEGVLMGEYTFIQSNGDVELARVGSGPHLAAVAEDARRSQKKIDLTHFEFELGQVYETPGQKKAIFLGYVSSYTLRVKNLETEGSKSLVPIKHQFDSYSGNTRGWGSAENHNNYKIVPKKLEMGSIWIDIADFEVREQRFLEAAYSRALNNVSNVVFRERHMFNNMVEDAKLKNVDIDIVSTLKMRAIEEITKGKNRYSLKQRAKAGHTFSPGHKTRMNEQEKSWLAYRKSYFGAFGAMKKYSRLANMTLYGMLPEVDDVFSDEWGAKLEKVKNTKKK